MPLSAETAAMVEELIGRASWATVATLNEAAGMVLERSQVEVPKSGAHQARPEHPDYPVKPLEESAMVDEATPASHVAQVVYDSPYAAAQEVGEMTYESRGGKTVDWQAENYTTPGTKSRYLEDAGKAAQAMIPEIAAQKGRVAMGEIPGLNLSSEELRSMGQAAP